MVNHWPITATKQLITKVAEFFIGKRAPIDWDTKWTSLVSSPHYWLSSSGLKKGTSLICVAALLVAIIKLLPFDHNQ